MTLAWGARVSAEFRARVIAMAAVLRCDPSWLMAIMAFETGRTFSPAARNAVSGATGLIQFMPSTAKGMGTTVEALAAMTALEQLEWVERYFAPYTGRLDTLSDAYMAVLWPRAVGRPESFVIFDRGTVAYTQNAGLDANKDGQITKAEASGYVARLLAEGLQPDNAATEAVRPGGLPSPTPQLPTKAGPPNQQKENRMGVALPLLAQLIPQVLGMFSARAQATIAEKTGADPKVAADFMQAMIAQVGHAVGVPVVDNTSATQAVAALTAAPPETQAVKVQALEAQALATVDALLKAGDKMSEWDAKKWDAEIRGKDAATDRTIKERLAALWDMTPTLVKNTEGQTWFILVLLGGALVYSLGLSKESFFTGLIGIAGGVFNQILKNKAQANDHRFDGTKESAEQSKALINALPRQGVQQ
jgi:hypothetical protein